MKYWHSCLTEYQLSSSRWTFVSINIKKNISYKLFFLSNFGRIFRYGVLTAVFQLAFLILLTRWSNFRVNVMNPTCSAFKIVNILESVCIDFSFKLTFYLTQANLTAPIICAWKCTLQKLDDFLNSPPLQYSRRILVIRTNSKGGSGIRLDHLPLWFWGGGRNHSRKIHVHDKRKGKIKQTDFHLLLCTPRDITLYIMVTLLIYVRIKPHVNVAFCWNAIGIWIDL